MLTNLHVKNLALIDEAEVTFGPGLNILTGETGAGKSVLIGSINLALGQKLSRDMLRKGKDSGLVELVFQIENEKILEKLKTLEVETEDGQLIITRKIQNGRSINRINGEACTLSMIRNVSSLLLDIHGQHEHQSLLYPDRQLEILDEYGREEIGPLLRKTETAYRNYRDVRKELQSCQMDEKEREREIAYLEYEIKEVEDAALQEGEEEDLEKRYRLMSNSRKIAETLNLVYGLTGGDQSAGELVGRALKEMSGISGFDTSLENMESTLSDVESVLADFNREVSDYLSEFTFSEEDFYETENRLNLINRLKSKYGKTIAEILHYTDKQRERLEQLQNFAERKAELEKSLQRAERALEEVSERLSEKRKHYAEELSGKITEELYDLNFLSVDFRIQFQRTAHYNKNGFDEIAFMISTNPGEQVRPLSKVVSGGELSRIMLAIKTLLADRDDTETLIFDEIDTGISGRTAQKVSEKMAEIGQVHQVICITHLAQIASMADHHFEIEKSVKNGVTTSSIRKLSGEEIVEELARILGGAEITQAVHDNAREMKDLADARKKAMSGQIPRQEKKTA